MDTVECIKTRRSIRSFTGQKVTHDILEQIIETAAFAPSWKNTQVTRYYAIEKEDVKAVIADEYSPDYNQEIIRKAPLLVALTMVRSRSGYERDGSFSTVKETGWQMFDCGIAAQTFCLAAHDKGLGTVIMGVFDYEKTAALLNIPDSEEITALIAVGYSDTKDVPVPKRKALDILLTYC